MTRSDNLDYVDGKPLMRTIDRDEKLTTALLDRLAHHATVITTKGKSYRMRKRRGTE